MLKLAVKHVSAVLYLHEGNLRKFEVDKSTGGRQAQQILLQNKLEGFRQKDSDGRQIHKLQDFLSPFAANCSCSFSSHLLHLIVASRVVGGLWPQR